MSAELLLPRPGGHLLPHRLGPPSTFQRPAGPLRRRVAYSAAHVVCDPLAERDPIATATLDWEATLAYRRYLWSLGLAVAEAMDTAQRGMGLDWTGAKELIRRSLAEARTTGGTIACGAGTDQFAPTPRVAIEEVVAAYEEQCGFVEGEVVDRIFKCPGLRGQYADRRSQTLGVLPRLANGAEDPDGNWKRITDYAAEHWHGQADPQRPDFQVSFAKFAMALDRISQLRNKAAHPYPFSRELYEELQIITCHAGPLEIGTLNMLLLAWQE